jgi:ankyrin repeat protein
MPKVLSHAIAAALCVVVLGASAASPQGPVQARKELTAMGLSYNNQDQFLSAVRKKDQIAIDLFVAGKGIDLNAVDPKSGMTALKTTYKAGDIKLTRYLLKAGAAPQPDDLSYAISFDNRALLQDLLSAPGFTKAAVTESVLMTAALSKKRDVVEVVLKAVDPANAAKVVTAKVINGLIFIDQLRDLALIESALNLLGSQSAAVLNSRGALPLTFNNWVPSLPLNYAAIKDTKSEIIPLLLKHGADVNSLDLMTTGRGPTGEMRARVPETPLMTAIRVQNLPAIALLLKSGADPNRVVVQDTFGFFAISTHKVTAMSYVEVTKPLHKSDPNFDQKKMEIVRLLNEAGAKTPEEIKG